MPDKKKGLPLLPIAIVSLALGAAAGTFLLRQPSVTVVQAPAQPAAAQPGAQPEAQPQPAPQPVPQRPEQPSLLPPMMDPATVEADPPQPLRPTQSMGHQAGLHRAPDPLKLTASAALVIDRTSGEVLASKNDNAVLPIASLTKLMTALVVMDARQPLEEQILVTDEDVDRERNSRSRLRVGSVLTRGDALHLALMSSENRAAHALGRHYPGGLPAFVTAMNAKARALGMKNTHFVDPTGLSAQNQSTARDVALLTAEAAKNPMLRTYSTTPQHLAEFGERRILYRNSNRLIKDPDWSIDLQKTGYIIEAGQCVAMQTQVAGQDLIMVILDAGSKSSRSGDAERLRRFAIARIAPDHPELLAEKKPEPKPAVKTAAKKPETKKAETKQAKARTKSDDRRVKKQFAQKDAKKDSKVAARKTDSKG